jgi:hypothetical protein
MKVLTLALLLFVPVACHAQIKYGIDQTYDRFENTTTLKATLSLLPPPDSTNVLLIVNITSKGERINVRPLTARADLLSKSDSWVYGAGESEWRLILNGSDRLLLGGAKRVLADVGRGYVMEGLQLEIPLSSLERIANAKQVEMRIGRTEFELKPEQIQTLKDLLARLP